MSTSQGTHTLEGSPGFAETSASLMNDQQIELREGYADVGGDVKLHYVEAGEGPLVARCGIRTVGRSRLGRIDRLDRRDESP